MIKSRFAIVTHIMTLLASAPDEFMTSNTMAGSLNVNPVLVRKELAGLKKLGLIESKEGKNGGVKLAKAVANIRLSELFLLAKGEGSILGYSKNEPNPQCPIGRQINDNLSKLYEELDANVAASLDKITLENFKNQF